MTPRIYVSARYGRKNDAVALAEKIRNESNCLIVARWLYEAPQSTDLSDPDAKPDDWAVMDFDDVQRSDALVLISDPENTLMTGGKHVEVGLALAMRKPVIVLGRCENVFHYHPLVSLFTHEDLLLKFLRANQPIGGKWVERTVEAAA